MLNLQIYLGDFNLFWNPRAVWGPSLPQPTPSAFLSHSQLKLTLHESMIRSAFFARKVIKREREENVSEKEQDHGAY